MSDGAPERPPIPRGQSTALAHRLVPDLIAADAPERPITVDQTNLSVVVGEQVVVKWLQPPAPTPNRALTLLEHLTEVGFAETPHFFGAEIVDDHVVALVTANVADSMDGWEWYVDLLTDELMSGGDVRSVSMAARLGAMAGRLHVALATPSRVLPIPTQWSTCAVEYQRAITLLATALAVVDGDAGDRLRSYERAIQQMIDALATVGDLDVQYLHGDLHVGQVLRQRDSLYLTDFDGNPVDADLPPLRTPMVDLASLVQSVDHVGRVVTKRHPELAAAVDGFIADATAATVMAYGKVAPVDDGVLGALRVVQELHEYVYAARYLPRWGYVPDAAMAALLT